MPNTKSLHLCIFAIWYINVFHLGDNTFMIEWYSGINLSFYCGKFLSFYGNALAKQ